MHLVSFLLLTLIIQSINQTIYGLIDPSIKQSMIRDPYHFVLPLSIQSIEASVQVQPIKQSLIKQKIDQSMLQSNDQSIDQSISQTINQSDESDEQSINQSNNQPIKVSRFSVNQYTEAVAVMSGCSNVAFSAPVYINGQGPFKLIVDTGSTTMSVVSKTCVNCGTVSPAFDPTGLSSVIDNGKVSVTYADGSSWSGAGFNGQVSVGDPLLGGSVAVSMIFATIESQDRFVNISQCGVYQTKKNWHQGIIGFAYPGLGSKGTDAWFSNYVAQTGVSNEYTIQMCVTPTGETSGNLWIGAYDKDYVAGQFIYVPIVKLNHYNTFLNKISLFTQYQGSGTSTMLPFSTSDYGPCNDGTGDVNCAIVDSGTTYMSFPTTVQTAMIAAIRADPGYQRYIPNSLDPLAARGCYRDSNFESFDVLNANLPTMRFTFGEDKKGTGSVTIELKPMNGYLVISYDASGNKYYCIGIGSTGTNAAILGYSFMNQFTIRHDIENSRMGFAPTRKCGEAAPIMPNLQWTKSDWSVCSSDCAGYQWRNVSCVDIFGVLRTDIDCYNGFAGPKPEIGQPCGQKVCPLVNSTRVTSVSINPSITQLNAGSTIDISFSFTGTPPSIQLYFQPINSVNKWPFIITKNASFIPSASPSNNQFGTYRWTVPSTLLAGQYVFGGFSQIGRYEFLDTANRAVTVVSSSDPSLGQSVCGSDGATGSSVCSGHGRCTVSSNNQPICTCVAGYTGPYCNVSTISTCSIQCLNEGVANLDDCTCKCPNQFSGVLCEYRFATITAVLTVDPLTVDGLAPGKNHQLFKNGLMADIAYAAGVPAGDMNVLSVFPSGSKGLRTAVTFTLALPTSTPDLRTHVSFLNGLPVVPAGSEPSQSNNQTKQTINQYPVYNQISSLSSGLFSQYITVMSVASFPPNDFRLSDSTGDDIIVTLTNHLTLIIGVACGIFGALLFMCVGCLCLQRRELKKALSSSSFRRRDSVVKRVEALNGPLPAPRIHIQ